MSSTSFSKEMRKATRDIHAISDALVNTKLLFALSDNKVWAEGLMIFYEIFRFLEQTMKNNKYGLLGNFIIDGLDRTEAFEKDLEFYLGEHWTASYAVRDEVAEYLVYLKNLEIQDPDLLIAFVYHLYMGLLSGGQILKRKRQLKDKLLRRKVSSEGYAVTDFGERSIFSLKEEIRSIMDSIANELPEEKKNQLLVESRKVFEWNNKIIRTVHGTDRVLLEKVIILLLIIFLLIYWFWW